MSKIRSAKCSRKRMVRRRSEFSVPNPIVLFLLWAAKSDPRILRSCAPITRRTQAARGFFVTFTAAWASVAAHYFLSTTVALSPAVVDIGSAAWGCGIFMLDRELVGHWSRNSLWLRLTLSASLGITVAIPVEMRIFEGRIDTQIAIEHAGQNRDAAARLQQRQQDIDNHQKDLEKQLSEIRRQIEQAGEIKEAEVVGREIPNVTTGIRGKGDAYGAADERLQSLRGQQSEVEQERQSLEADRARIAVDYHNQEISPIKDFLTRYEAMKAAMPFFSSMWWLSWLLTFVLVVIDMFPVLMKTIVPPSDYDNFLAIQAREIIQRAERLAVYNECQTEHLLLSPQPSTLDLFEQIFGDDSDWEEYVDEQESEEKKERVAV